MKTKKTLIIACSILECAAIGYFMFSGKSTKGKLTVEMTKVEKGNLDYSITATGTVEPVTKVEVGTQVSGIIDKLYVDYNSTVKKGEVIAEMDRVTLMSDLKSRQASFDGNKSEFDYQKKNYQRNKALHDKGLISDTDYEQSLYNYQKATSSYESSKADLAKAQRNLAYTTITSPIDGVVINRAVEEGQTVAAGFSTPTLFTIAADLTKMQVVANVDEADIGGVKVGQRVSFTVDAYPDDTFNGKVTQVRLEAATTSNVVTYEVVISADNPDLKLKPGLTANVNIYTIDLNDVSFVASKALRFTPSKMLLGENVTIKDCNSKQKVWTKNGDVYTAIPVTTGISNGINTQIISGVEFGTEVVLDISSQQMMTNMPTQDTNKESSPFMPSRPGAKK